MNEASPYKQPQMGEQPPPLEAPVYEPPAIKVFGILHLIFGGLGILGGIVGIVSLFFASAALGIDMGRSEESEAIMNAQRSYLGQMTWLNVMGAVFSLVLAALIIVAGLKLVRKRRDALAWSNRYAWTSIGLKVVNLVVTLLVVMPAMNQMMGEISGVGDGSNENMMRTITSVSTVLGGVISMVYPILTLVLLNREPVRRFLESRP